MKYILTLLMLLFAALPSQAVNRTWTNSLSGDWFAATNWSPNGVPGASDIAYITNNGTYTVYAATGSVAAVAVNVGGSSGAQTFIYGTSGQLFVTNSIVRANGELVITNGGLRGALLVQSGGKLLLNGVSGNLQLYTFALTNQGTVIWSNGSLSIGGSNSEITYVTNSGLWQITGNANMNYGGGGRSLFLNSGTLRKVTGVGTTGIGGFDVLNSPSGIVDVLSGTLQLSAFRTNVLSGTYIATSPGILEFRGNNLEAGATNSGSGLIQFTSGTLLLRTNNLPGLKLVGGDVYIVSTNTFQLAGAITNLTLDGANLRGTNRIAGTLTCHAGNLDEQLTVQPGGQLLLASPTGTQLYTLKLINQGNIIWSAGSLSVGSNPGTIISNGGNWTITGDGAINHGGGNPAYFTNYGTVHKTAGAGVSAFSGFAFLNQTSGIVEVDTGTIQLPNNYTNATGTLWLNGGNFTTFGTFGMTGGSLNGTGTNLAATFFDGGTISPGQSPGFLHFKNGLTLGANATLVIEGTGTIPGSQYDQVAVTGGISLSNCTLQVTTLPSVPLGTTFVIITNLSGTAISGRFNGLPDNSLLTINGQLFRIHYTAPGNHITLVRDNGAGATQLSLGPGGYSNGVFRLSGLGGSLNVFTIQATTNFIQWTNIGAATGDAGGTFNFIDTNASKFRYRFYRTTN